MVSRSSNTEAVALYNLLADQDDELSFKKGSVLKVAIPKSATFTSRSSFKKQVAQFQVTMNCHAVDGPPSKTVPPDRPKQNNWSPRTEYCSHTWSPPAADGPILGMVFSKSVEPEKWTTKDEAVYAVSLRLGFQGELNISTECIRVSLYVRSYGLQWQ